MEDCTEEGSKCWFCRKVLEPYEETVFVWEMTEDGEQVFVCKECNNEKSTRTLHSGTDRDS